MSYSASSPPMLIASGLAGKGQLWFYSNTDADTTVDGAGYITNAKKLGMKAGDRLVYLKSDASPLANFLFNVSAINATTGAADLSNSTAITATNSD